MHSSLSYNVISTKGDLMFDGNRVPGNADGMAAFSVDSNHTVIVRNHELGRTSGKLMGPFKNPKKINSEEPWGLTSTTLPPKILSKACKTRSKSKK